jgi:hypothetical protein
VPGVGDVRARRRVELPHRERSVRERAEGVDEARDRVVGRERDRKQAALVLSADLTRHIEERRREDRAILDDPHGAASLDDEQARGVAGR